MMGFLFWNIAKQPLHNLIAELVSEYEVDVLMLAESDLTPEIVVTAINKSGKQFSHIPGLCTRIDVYTRFSKDFAPAFLEDDHFTVRHLRVPGYTDILLAITHAISRTHYTEHDQTMEAVVLSASIRQAERQIGHSRTVLVGDLNMNPFDEGVVTASGLHGVMSREIAAKGSRSVQGRAYPYFYNPMWSLLGDFSPGPPGTYYRYGSGHQEYFWNMFDQVLVRADLLECFDGSGVTA